MPRRIGLGLMIAVVASLSTTSLSQIRKEEKAVKRDFSQVKTLSAAQILAAKGELTKVLLFPAEFGGEDIPQNAVYVTPEAAEARKMIVGTLRRFFKEGLIDKLDVRPEYKGDSFVPSRLAMNATHSKKNGAFNPTIDVW